MLLAKSDPPPPAGRGDSRVRPPAALAALSAAATAGLVVLWLLAAGGRFTAPPALARALVAAALAAGAAALAVGARERDSNPLLVAALLAAAIAVRFTGLRYGLAERYNPDEGVYTYHATRINQGEFFHAHFVYPHLVYYLEAFAIWLAGQLGDGYLALTRALYGVEEWRLGARLATRFVTALLGALSVAAVALAAARLAGRTAALAAGLLLLFSPLYNEGSHYNTCDIPAAFFACLTLERVTRLLERESARDYVLAGLWAGLAAASKYPAGLVAVAVAAAWLRSRLSSRALSPGLLWAALAAALAFVLANPALVARPEVAFGPNGILYAYRGYRHGGWPGVLADSNPLFYLGRLAASFGLPALLLGAAGLVLAPRALRSSALWLLPFPLASFALISQMRIVVDRNLYPLVPFVSLLGGVGVAALAAAARGRAGRAVSLAVLTLAVAPPAVKTAGQTVHFVRPETREVAREFILREIAPGARILREDYTPKLPSDVFSVGSVPRFAARVPLERLRAKDVDLLLLSSLSYGRFFEGRLSSPDVRDKQERYHTIFASFPAVAEFAPSWSRGGPTLKLLRNPPPEDAHRRSALLPASAAYVPSATMRKPGQAHVRFAQPGQWCVFKADLEPGAYRMRLTAEPPPVGSLEVRTLRNRLVSQHALDGQSEPALQLPARERYFLSVSLAQGTVLHALEIAPAEEAP